MSNLDKSDVKYYFQIYIDVTASSMRRQKMMTLTDETFRFITLFILDYTREEKL